MLLQKPRASELKNSSRKSDSVRVEMRSGGRIREVSLSESRLELTVESQKAPLPQTLVDCEHRLDVVLGQFELFSDLLDI